MFEYYVLILKVGLLAINVLFLPYSLYTLYKIEKLKFKSLNEKFLMRNLLLFIPISSIFIAHKYLRKPKTA